MTRKNKMSIAEAANAVAGMLGELKQGMQKFLGKDEAKEAFVRESKKTEPVSTMLPADVGLISRPGWTYRGARRNAARARKWHTFKPEEIVPTSRALVIAWPKRQRLAARLRKTAAQR